MDRERSKRAERGQIVAVRPSTSSNTGTRNIKASFKILSHIQKKISNNLCHDTQVEEWTDKVASAPKEEKASRQNNIISRASQQRADLINIIISSRSLERCVIFYSMSHNLFIFIVNTPIKNEM
jgi:hypothetical protein